MADANPLLRALLQFESGGRNITNVDATTSSGRARGFFQITDGTWKEFGGDKFGFATAQDAPFDVQWQIAQKIPLSRWDPKTLNYMRSQGVSFNPHLTLGQNAAQYGGTPEGSLSGRGPGRSPSGAPSLSPGPGDASIRARGGVDVPIPGTTITSTPDAAAKPDAGTPWTNLAGDLGADLKPLMSKKDQGEPGGGGGEDFKPMQFAPGEVRNYRGPGGNPSQQQVAQTYGNTLASMAPLQWGSAPPGQAPYANVGVGVPGMSLASQMQQMQQMRQMYAMMGYGDNTGIGGIPMSQDMQPMGFSYGQG